MEGVFLLFKEKKTKFYSIEVNTQSGNSGNGRTEGEIFIAKINGGTNNGKEYLVSVGKENGYAELYDFNNSQIYQISTTSFLKREMNNLRGVVLNYTLNNINYIIIGYVTLGTINYYYLYRFKFTSIDIKNNNPND